MMAVGMIPARYGSTRLPGKHLLERVIVATDDRRVLEVVKAFEGKASLSTTSAPRLAKFISLAKP